MRREGDEPAAGAVPAAVGAPADPVARRGHGQLAPLPPARIRGVPAPEDALADAFAAALVAWKRRGVPANPEAWLMAVARRKLIDAARRRRGGAEAVAPLLLIADELAEASAGAAEMPDHRLALIFAFPHPAIDTAIRAPLILPTILRFDAAVHARS